jgi:hypothetical protein
VAGDVHGAHGAAAARPRAGGLLQVELTQLQRIANAAAIAAIEACP